VLWARNLAAALAAGLIVGAALIRQWGDGGCWPALDNPVTRWIGKRSYSVYLLHLLVIHNLIQPLHRHGGPGGFAFYVVVGLAVLLPLSALSYAVLERPFIARRAAWRGTERTAPAVPAAIEPELATAALGET
jgi:peptidoglycan/LPS O-acetylase OafA/YrhL